MVTFDDSNTYTVGPTVALDIIQSIKENEHLSFHYYCNFVRLLYHPPHMRWAWLKG